MAHTVGDPHSLTNLYRGALEAGAQASRLDARTEEASAVIGASLASFRVLMGRVEAVGMWSKNEYYEDVSTSEAVFLMLPYAYAEVLVRQRTTRRLERMRLLAQAEELLKKFTKLVDHMKLLPEDERKLFQKRGRFSIADVGRKRELKIKQFQKEKELKERVQALRVRNDPTVGDEPLDSDLDMIASLLHKRAEWRKGRLMTDDDEDPEVEEFHREVIEMVIRLCWARAYQLLADLRAEKELLDKAPPEEDEAEEKARLDERDKGKGKGKARAVVDSTWKLESRIGGRDENGGLLDKQGRPLRPFTITSSSSKSRKQHQDDVFQPDHRLPSMSIDEYLAEEMARGNFISGGGPQSGEQLTSDEQLQLETENDGTLAAEVAEWEQRRKGEYWSLYTEDHRRGSGNTMNRG